MIDLLHYQFFINALLAALLTSITCGITGTYIVARRMVFIGGGISHASFGGVGLGYFLGFDPILGAGVFSLIIAMLIEGLSERRELRRDTLIGVMWSFGMAVGVIFVFLTPGYAANLMTYLFGNILTVSSTDLMLLSVLLLILILVFTVFFRDILAISFDQEYAKTLGIPVLFINTLLLGLIALTIVFNIRVVGIILVISMLTIPQATANLFSKRFGTMIFLSVLFALFASFAGLVLSNHLDIPSGATIVFCAILIFLLALPLAALRRRRQQPG